MKKLILAVVLAVSVVCPVYAMGPPDIDDGGMGGESPKRLHRGRQIVWRSGATRSVQTPKESAKKRGSVTEQRKPAADRK